MEGPHPGPKTALSSRLRRAALVGKIWEKWPAIIGAAWSKLKCVASSYSTNGMFSCWHASIGLDLFQRLRGADSILWNTLPHTAARKKAVVETVEKIHETGATLGSFLVGLHATRASCHHYLLRDDTLRRMLPRRHRVVPYPSWLR
jgi:hypothetical protein